MGVIVEGVGRLEWVDLLDVAVLLLEYILIVLVEYGYDFLQVEKKSI